MTIIVLIGLLLTQTTHPALRVVQLTGDPLKSSSVARINAAYHDFGVRLANKQISGSYDEFVQQAIQSNIKFLTSLFSGKFAVAGAEVIRGTECDCLLLDIAYNDDVRPDHAYLLDRPEDTLLLLQFPLNLSRQDLLDKITKLINVDSPPAPQEMRIVWNEEANSTLMAGAEVTVINRPARSGVAGYSYAFLINKTGSEIDVLIGAGKELVPNAYASWMKYLPDRFPPLFQRVKDWPESKVLELAVQDHQGPAFEARAQVAMDELLRRRVSAEHIVAELHLNPDSLTTSSDTSRVATLLVQSLRPYPTEFASFARKFLPIWSEHSVAHKEEIASLLSTGRTVQDADFSDAVLSFLEHRQQMRAGEAGRKERHLDSLALMYLQAHLSGEEEIQRLDNLQVPSDLRELKSTVLAIARGHK